MLCFAAPPPAFGVAPPDAYYRAPAPPPPPLVKAESRRMFVKEMVRPRTELICSGIEQGPELRAACREFAHYMATPRTYAFIPVFTAFCEPNLCWSSCGGQGYTDTEGWHDCKDAKCADASCLEFLKRECPSGMQPELQKIHDDECTLHPPLPPQPKPPPPPPNANPAPPEILDYFQRVAKDELDSDADCLPVDYETCQKVLARFMNSLGGPNQLYTGVLDVSLAPCEGLESDENCFLGCSWGTAGTYTGTYHYVIERERERLLNFNTHRCKESMHPFCACNPSGVPPPPAISPPPSPGSTGDYEFVSMGPDLDPMLGYPGAFVRRISNERAFPGSEIATSTHFRCDKDNGRDAYAALAQTPPALGSARRSTTHALHSAGARASAPPTSWATCAPSRSPASTSRRRRPRRRRRRGPACRPRFLEGYVLPIRTSQ